MWFAGSAVTLLKLPAAKPEWQVSHAPVVGCAASAIVMPTGVAPGRSISVAVVRFRKLDPASWQVAQPVVMPAWPVAPIV